MSIFIRYAPTNPYINSGKLSTLKKYRTKKIKMSILSSTSCKNVAKTVSNEAFINAEKREKVMLANTIGITNHKYISSKGESLYRFNQRDSKKKKVVT